MQQLYGQYLPYSIQVKKMVEHPKVEMIPASLPPSGHSGHSAHEPALHA
jgi:hypothetical protein